MKPIRLVNREVKDPVRYPKVITPIENDMKMLFKKSTEGMVVELTKNMVNIKKK